MQRSGNLHVLRMLNSGINCFPCVKCISSSHWCLAGHAAKGEFTTATSIGTCCCTNFNCRHLQFYESLYGCIIETKQRIQTKEGFGNNSAQLFSQLYIENLCLTLVSLFIAWFLVEISVFPLNKYFDVIQQPNGIFDIGITIAILILQPLTASIYPFLNSNTTRLSIHYGNRQWWKIVCCKKPLSEYSVYRGIHSNSCFHVLRQTTVWNDSYRFRLWHRLYR